MGTVCAISPMQAENSRYHTHSLAHKFVLASWFRPDEPVCIACNATVEDDQVEPKLTKRRRPSYQVESAGASTPGQKPRRQSDALESIADLVGPASETREAHLLRHGGGQLTCPRCRYYVHGTAWTATYGSCMAPTGPRRRIVWLAERPARQGDAWALGCVFCASYECRPAKCRRWGPSARRRGGFGRSVCEITPCRPRTSGPTRSL